MNAGKTLFVQVMEFVPWKTFGRIIAKHKGDCGVRTLSCADLFRILAFSQLAWRESLRDIEVCRAANQTKLFQTPFVWKTGPEKCAVLILRMQLPQTCRRQRSNGIPSGLAGR
jgi:Domain of unknown function (DUF4372)